MFKHLQTLHKLYIFSTGYLTDICGALHDDYNIFELYTFLSILPWSDFKAAVASQRWNLCFLDKFCCLHGHDQTRTASGNIIA